MFGFMVERTPAYIFHITRSDGSSTFVHPFYSRAGMVSLLEAGAVEGRYGSDPSMESVAAFREEMYRLVDSAVRSWVNDVRFIPRVLLSAGTFVCLYLILSLAMKKPLPVFDEFTISFAAAFLMYGMVGRANARSDLATRKRNALRTAVDQIIFEESEFIGDVERELSLLEEQEEEALLQSLFEISGRPYAEHLEPESHGTEAIRLCEYLARQFGQRRFKLSEEAIVQNLDERHRTAAVRQLLARRFDIPLYAIYVWLKRDTIRAF